MGAFRDDDLGEGAFVDRFVIHGRLIGFDFRNHVTGPDLVAFFLQPLGQIAFLHGGRERRHKDADRHATARFYQLIALVLPRSVGASISASNMDRMRSTACSSVRFVSVAKMRAAWRATSAMSMPQACGSSKARRKET